MPPEKLTALREDLITLRKDCLEHADFNGALILSQSIRWLYFKIEDRPYEEPKD